LWSVGGGYRGGGCYAARAVAGRDSSNQDLHADHPGPDQRAAPSSLHMYYPRLSTTGCGTPRLDSVRTYFLIYQRNPFNSFFHGFDNTLIHTKLLDHLDELKTQQDRLDEAENPLMVAAQLHFQIRDIVS